MQRAVALIPAAFQYPENACARIRLDNRAYTSDNFIVTPWRQNIPIVLNGSQVGDLDVYYIEEPPHSGDGLFLEEEERLLRVIGERLSKVLWLKRSEEALKESEERYRVLTEQIAEGVALVQNAKFCYVNPAFCRMFAIAGAQTVQDKPLCDLTAELSDDIARIYEIDQGRIVLEKHEKVHHLVRPDRSIWLQVCHSPITFRGEPALLSTFKDISEIKEEQLAAQRRADLLTSENRVLRSSLKERYRLGDIIGRSPGIQHVYELILKAAAADAAVAIFGESGSGKELVAHAIHQNSTRCHSSFVAVNCGAIQESLFEREFFGHRKGAFSSAHADSPGYLDLANSGTLFLDEVGELSLSMQAKLLRAIEGGGYRPIGATETLSADFRIISASNTALSEKVTSGQLRSDFFYRIQVIQIQLPPLRHRKEDIPLLVDHFLPKMQSPSGPVTIPGHVMDSLIAYDRQCPRTAECASALCDAGQTRISFPLPGGPARTAGSPRRHGARSAPQRRGVGKNPHRPGVAAVWRQPHQGRRRAGDFTQSPFQKDGRHPGAVSALHRAYSPGSY